MVRALVLDSIEILSLMEIIVWRSLLIQINKLSIQLHREITVYRQFQTTHRISVIIIKVNHHTVRLLWIRHKTL